MSMDKQKVIKAYEICDLNYSGEVCKKCPYKEPSWNGAWEDDETGQSCWDVLKEDVLKLLKESPTQK